MNVRNVVAGWRRRKRVSAEMLTRIGHALMQLSMLLFQHLLVMQVVLDMARGSRMWRKLSLS